LSPITPAKIRVRQSILSGAAESPSTCIVSMISLYLTVLFRAVVVGFPGLIERVHGGANVPVPGFVAGGLFGCLNFVGSVVLTFIPNQVIVYQQAPPWPLTLHAGTPGQVQLLDILGITVFVGLLTALLMPKAGASRLDRWLPSGTLGRVAFGSAVLLGLFLLTFSPALAVHAAGLDTEVAYRKSPFTTVPLYGQAEAYPADVLQNYMAACTQRGSPGRCRCTLASIQRRFTIGEYRAMEERIAKGDVPREMMAVVDDCRY